MQVLESFSKNKEKKVVLSLILDKFITHVYVLFSNTIFEAQF